MVWLFAMERIGRNDRCPCGSGKKFKKCCEGKLARAGSAAGYTRADRASAWEKLESFIMEELGSEDDEAMEALWGRWADHERRDGIEDCFEQTSDQIGDHWFSFDRRLPDGQFVVDRFFVERGGTLTSGEALYLRAMRASSMRLYEIEDSRPGESLSLRDLLEGDGVTVQERLGSKTLHRFEWIAARVVAGSASGKPELEGVLHVSELMHQGVRDQLRRHREDFLSDDPADLLEFYKEMPRFFHDAWMGSLLEPPVPNLATTDGDVMVKTNVSFEVSDPTAVERALDADDAFARPEPKRKRWIWSGKNPKGDDVLFGELWLSEGALVLETNSIPRGERGRGLVERMAGGDIRHRGTLHQDLQRLAREGLKDGAGDEPRLRPDEKESEWLTPEVKEALTLDHLARHYRAWVDEPVPAIDDLTPREAARREGMRPRVVELVHGIELLYQRALAMGEPAYDPSWMWAELGLADETVPHPPPLAHERVAQLVPGSGELCRSIAEQRRVRPGFDDRSTLFPPAELRMNLEGQRLVRGWEGGAGAGGPPLWPLLERIVDFELHRRKSFWVDEALAFLLAQTELDAVGRELRAPFPSFALVFTDRHVLSLCERLLAREQGNPLAGHYLEVATVFVTEQSTGDGREFALWFALDALGSDLPQLLHHRLPLTEEGQVQVHLEGVAPRPRIEPAMPDVDPLRCLLRVTLNAILYATSAGVEPVERKSPRGTLGRRRPAGSDVLFSSESVWHLPGPIEISHVRRLQELDRIPSGRTVLRRFMVRGHWRRAAAGWADQRMRWVQPYWKGPDLAAVIERTYKLKQ